VEYLFFQFSKTGILNWFAKVQLSFSVVTIQNSAKSMEGLSSDSILYNIEKPIFYENHTYCTCSARDWERSGLLEENPQCGCSDICASLKGPL
jgi:hypothetical protein